MAKKSKALSLPKAPPRKESIYQESAQPEGFLGSVTIAGDPVYIYRKEDLVGHGGVKVDGLYDPTTDEIHLEAHLSVAAERETLLHEIWHAIQHKFAMNLDRDQDEAIAMVAGAGYSQALALWFSPMHLQPWETEPDD